MSNVIRFRREMSKDQLAAHLNEFHFKNPIKPGEVRRWTKDTLLDHHRLLHLAHPVADHEHRA